MLVGTCWKTVSAKVAENGQTAADHDHISHTTSSPELRVTI